MGKIGWEHYSHPADMGIRGFGPTKEQAFGQAALALTAVITDLQKVEPKKAVEINCEEQDDELLFVCWLNALIYEMATRCMLFSKFEVNIEHGEVSSQDTLRQNQKTEDRNLTSDPSASLRAGVCCLKSKAWGEKIDLKKHPLGVEVKAATYADLKVRQNKDGGWLVQCIVDV